MDKEILIINTIRRYMDEIKEDSLQNSIAYNIRIAITKWVICFESRLSGEISILEEDRFYKETRFYLYQWLIQKGYINVNTKENNDSNI